MEVEVSEEYLGSLLYSYTASFRQKPRIFKTLFQYLCSVANEFRFASPAQSNAVIFLVSRTRSAFPVAVYFHNVYHSVRSFNRLQFSTLVSTTGALVLLGSGLSLLPVLIGTAIAILCFWRLTALPIIKGATRNRLEAEQALLMQYHDFQQTLNQVCQVRSNHQNHLERQQSVLNKMMQNPELYPTQIALYQRSIKCTQDYLNLCDRAIEQYELAIRSAFIQIETSKLSAELSSNFVDPRIEFGLDLLKDQIASCVPPQLFNYDSNHHPTD